MDLLFEVFQDKEAKRKLRRLLRNHDGVDEPGLGEIVTEVQGNKCADMVHGSDSLSLVINDALRWVGNNMVSMKNRFSGESEAEFSSIRVRNSFRKVIFI